MNRVYRDKMDCVRLSASGKQSLIAELATAGEKPAPRPRRILRTGLVTAAIAGLLTVAAGAALLMVPVLRNYFVDSSQYVYQKNSQVLDLSQTIDGWTLTLADCVGDGRFLYIGMELTAPEGIIPNPSANFDWYDLVIPDGAIGRTGNIVRLPDNDPADNRVQFAFWQGTYHSLNHQTLDLAFGKLSHRIQPGSIDVIEHEGIWRFPAVSIDFPQNEIHLMPNQAIAFLDGKTTITDVKVTPLSVEVSLSGGSLQDIHTVGVEKNGCYGVCNKSVNIALYGVDGAKLELPELRNCGGYDHPEQATMTVIFSYQCIVDLESLDHIEICGTSIPLK